MSVDLRQRQLAFAAHLRDPARVAAPAGIEDRRLQVYRELFINNIAGLLAGTFPVCHRILGEARWGRLMRAFYAGHKAHTPYFLELPREFVEWLPSRDAPPADEPPFLAELAHYEWVELALSISDAEPDPQADPAGDLLRGRPVLSPLAWPLAYRWPVPRLSVDFQPAEPPPQPTFVVVHRRADGGVGFLEIDAPTARLLELAEAETALTGAAMLEQVAVEFRARDPEAFRERGRARLEDLRARGIVAGVIPVP